MKSQPSEPEGPIVGSNFEREQQGTLPVELSRNEGDHYLLQTKQGKIGATSTLIKKNLAHKPSTETQERDQNVVIAASLLLPFLLFPLSLSNFQLRWNDARRRGHLAGRANWKVC